MLSFIQMFLVKSWQFFSIPWPGFNFTIGQAFLAALTSVGALTMILKMVGVSPGSSVSSALASGNNRNIRISKARKDDTK